MFTYRQNSRVLQEIGVGEHDGDVRFLTGSKIIGVSRMRNEKYAIWPVFMPESPKFLHLIGNRGRRTRWWRQILKESRNKTVLRMRNEKYAIWRLVMAESPICRTAQQWTCELGYGADTMFRRTYFLFVITLQPFNRSRRNFAETCTLPF